MQEIKIYNQSVDDLLRQLNTVLKGNLLEQWGEQILTFSNELGHGRISSISFDWGVSLFDFDVCLNKEVKLIHFTEAETPVEFIFISNGSLRYVQDSESEEVELERFQNIIVSPKRESRKIFVFPKKEKVRVNFIQLHKKKYSKKKNNNLKYLNDVLLSVFEEEANDLPFKHFGNFNLEIADKLNEIRSNDDKGISRTLGIEGRLNIILAIQILEHHKFENDTTLPDSLTTNDIRKIHKLAEYIIDNISEPLTLAVLSKESGLSGKKLQVGFKMLYGKTVNEHIKVLKLEISRDLLRNTDLSVSEVVYKIGIRSRSYFSKIFFEKYMVLPTAYRANLKSKSKY